jgi:hypothetical protein
MTITRTDRNQNFANGNLVSEQVVQVDVTAEVVTLDLHQKLRDFVTVVTGQIASRSADIDVANTAITAQQTQRDTAIADIATFTAARDAAQVIIDDGVSTATQKTQARNDKAVALANLARAKDARQAALLALDVLRMQKDRINDSAAIAKATVALLRLVLGSDLLTDTAGT